MLEQGVFDESAWAALVPCLQESGANWAKAMEAGFGREHAASCRRHC